MTPCDMVGELRFKVGAKQQMERLQTLSIVDHNRFNFRCFVRSLLQRVVPAVSQIRGICGTDKQPRRRRIAQSGQHSRERARPRQSRVLIGNHGATLRVVCEIFIRVYDHGSNVLGRGNNVVDHRLTSAVVG